MKTKLKAKYVHFEKLGEEDWKVYNHLDEHLGFIQLERVGRFMHWCFHPLNGTYYTNGCLKEIVAFITSLYGRNKK